MEYTIRGILTIDLSKRKVYARFAPRSLTDEQKLTRVHCCKNVSKKIKILICLRVLKHSAFNMIVKPSDQCLDGSRLFRQNTKNMRFQKSEIKIMFVYFYKRTKALFTTNLKLKITRLRFG